MLAGQLPSHVTVEETGCFPGQWARAATVIRRPESLRLGLNRAQALRRRRSVRHERANAQVVRMVVRVLLLHLLFIVIVVVHLREDGIVFLKHFHEGDGASPIGVPPVGEHVGVRHELCCRSRTDRARAMRALSRFARLRSDLHVQYVTGLKQIEEFTNFYCRDREIILFAGF